MTQTEQRVSAFPQSIKHVINMAIENKKTQKVFPKTVRSVGVPKRIPMPTKPRVYAEFETFLAKIAIIETDVKLDYQKDHILVKRKNGQVLKLTVELLNKPE